MVKAIRHYVDIAKPGILSANLVSTAGGFFLASRGRVDTALLLATVTGVSLVVASACVFNNYLDRDLDKIMERTCNRVLPRGAVPARAACLYAAFLAIIGAVLLETEVNTLSLVVVSAGFIIYVGVYSLLLKRTCVYATLIGSLAGAAPPLAGYCAAANRFDLGAAILTAIFVLWQVPHYYAIGIFRCDDYAAAKIPVLPVQQGATAAKRHIVCYILLYTAAAPMLTLCGYTGYRYLAAATASGLIWLFIALSGNKTSNERLWAWKLYIFSILAMLVLSLMMSLDAIRAG
ncbi:MAG: heme o synthase [Syntrophobacteraceae bacterium]|nr:heme o synthase [Syntrophobacteraceae bacterium]